MQGEDVGLSCSDTGLISKCHTMLQTCANGTASYNSCILFICGLFNDAVSSSDYIESDNTRMVKEKLFGKNIEVIDQRLI
jgi:hypothetical protein